MACTNETIEYHFNYSLTYIGTVFNDPKYVGSFKKPPKLLFGADGRPYIEWNYKPLEVYDDHRATFEVWGTVET
jgi:hypothetical protein